MDEKTPAPRAVTRRPHGGRQPRPRGPRCAGEDWVDVCEDHGRHQARGAPGCVAFTSAPVCPDVPINRSLRVRGHVVCRTDDIPKNNQDIGYIETYS